MNDIVLSTADGSDMGPEGRISIPVRFGCATTTVDFVVSSRFTHCLLIGLDTIKRLGMVLDYNTDLVHITSLDQDLPMIQN